MFTLGRLDIGIRTRGAGTPAVPAAPVSSSAPAITGSPIVGGSLSCSTGGWTGFPAPTFTYQWIWADTSANISGATSSIYTPVSGDLGHTLKCAVTATNSQGNATANSNTTAAVVSAPVNSVAPAVTGTTTVGQTLSTTNGTWSNTPTSYAYQWKWADTGAAISGATASTYVLASGDVGHTIKCTVTASNAAGSASADSNTTAAVTAGVTTAFQADFTAISALPAGVSFSRATAGTYFDGSGVLQTAAIDAPRSDFAWNGSAWIAVGLLIEEQRTNLLLQSQGSWGAAGNFIVVTTGIADPGGTNTALTLTATANGAFNVNNYYFAGISSLTVGAAYTGSLWMRRRTGTGTVSFYAGPSVQRNVTLTSSWLRFDHIQTAAATTQFFQVDILTNGDQIDVAFGQFEAGSFPTSYIPTTSAAVTRSADIVQLTGAALVAALASTGTIIAQIGQVGSSSGRIIGTDVSQTPLYMFDNTTVKTYDGVTGYIASASLPGGNTFQANSNRVAVGWDATPGETLVADGGTVDIGAFALYGGGTVTGVVLGSLGGSSNFLNTHFESLAIYTSRLSDTDLQAKSVVGAAF